MLFIERKLVFSILLLVLLLTISYSKQAAQMAVSLMLQLDAILLTFSTLLTTKTKHIRLTN
nr:MAG TPA: hypothetical protein [Caudoviricetes sp.]